MMNTSENRWIIEYFVLTPESHVSKPRCVLKVIKVSVREDRIDRCGRLFNG